MRVKLVQKLPCNLISDKSTTALPFFENKTETPNIENEGEVWLTAQEAAVYLRLSVESLRNMTSNGKVPHYKLNRRVRYLKSELRTLLKPNKRGA